MKEFKKVDPKLLPEVNIGIVGHVSHGKTTLVKALTGKLTLSHSEELKRGITIRLGYADVSIYKCVKCGKYSTNEKCPYCFSDTELQRTASLIDAPGHETLMATVLSGANLMDGAILIIAANEKCPQPQTREHLTALEVVGIKNVIIVQNKIDLVPEDKIIENYNQIKGFIKGTILENSPIIPVSAQYGINVDVLLETIEKLIPTPVREEEKEPLMYIARSFDINRPGAEPERLKGGVLGGSIIQGKLKVGDEIEVRPGITSETKSKSIFTKVISIQKAGMDIEEAGSGGLLGLMTELDPHLTKSDALVGSILGLPGKLPEVRQSLKLEVKLLKRVVGSREMIEVDPVRVGENLMVNVGAARSVGSVSSIKKNVAEMKLKIPICVKEGERAVVSRLVQGRWRLIGYGNIL